MHGKLALVVTLAIIRVLLRKNILTRDEVAGVYTEAIATIERGRQGEAAGDQAAIDETLEVFQALVRQSRSSEAP